MRRVRLAFCLGRDIEYVVIPHPDVPHVEKIRRQVRK